MKNGATLIIDDGSQIYSSTGYWTGIEVEGGGTLEITGPVTTIAHATKGVKALNNTYASILDIYDATFCNNEIGIYIDAWTGAALTSTITIESCLFRAPLFPGTSDPVIMELLFRV